MFCNDPFLTFLKTHKYNVVSLPKADIRPLQILTRQGKDLERLGELATAFVPGGNIPLPALKKNVRAANISGQRTSDMSLGIGLSILGNILGAMGGSKLGLDTKYSRATSVAFEFQDILEDSVEIAKVDQFLKDADVSPFAQYVAQLLEADDLYVTTAVIKSTKFTVEAKTSGGATLEVSIPEIQEVVGGNVKVAGNASVASKVTYSGAVPLGFGFKAFRLFYTDGRYKTLKPLPPGAGAMRGLGEEQDGEPEPFISDSAFVNLKDA